MHKESGATTVPVPEGVARWRAAVDRSPVGPAPAKVAERTVEGFLEVSSYRSSEKHAVETGSELGDLRRPIAPRRKSYRRETRAAARQLSASPKSPL